MIHSLSNANYLWVSDPAYSTISIRSVIDIYSSLLSWNTVIVIWSFTCLTTLNTHNDIFCIFSALQWRHNERDGVSNHQPQDCLLNRLFGRRSKKTSTLRVIGLCGGIHRWPVNSSNKGPVAQKMFPFDDVITLLRWHGKSITFLVKDKVLFSPSGQ